MAKTQKATLNVKQVGFGKGEGGSDCSTYQIVGMTNTVEWEIGFLITRRELNEVLNRSGRHTVTVVVR